MPQQFSNNARSTLASSINNSATSLTIQSGAADLFPAANVGTGSVPSADNWFKATLQDASGNVEIIYVRTRNAGSAVFSNILRAQEGTTARTFVAGAVIGLRVTAEDIRASIGIPASDNTFSGGNTFQQQISVDQGVNYGGNFATLVADGKFTVTYNGTEVTSITDQGQVSGSFLGNVTGDVTGNAGTVTNGVYTTGNQTIAGNKTFSGIIGIGSDWTVRQSGTSLVFSYQGTAKLSLTSDGALTAVNNVTAYGSI
jgi:hypothetical protein